jgi:hypothetical protein
MRHQLADLDLAELRGMLAEADDVDPALCREARPPSAFLAGLARELGLPDGAR